MGMVFQRWLFSAALIPATVAVAAAQTPPPARPLTRNTEPGLEQAVKWKWQAVASEGEPWGERRPGSMTASDIDTAEPTPTPLPAAPENQVYIIKSGDRLVHIAKKFNVTVVQLKGFNNLTSDLIHIGQELKIPTYEQARAIAPFPEPPKPRKKDPKAGPAPAYDQDSLILQIFLDRENFSVGSIDGKASQILGKVAHLYQTAHPDVKNPGALQRKAQETVREPFTVYTLKAEDFEFIVPPKPLRADSGEKKAEGGPRGGALYQALISSPRLAYHSPWEFVAERFHSDEDLIRALNPHITTVPQAGTQFRVPNVRPFAIESALVPPLQPRANPALPVTALIEDLSILQIFQGGELVAVMPVSGARPGLRGRGTWIILDAIPRPRLATKQEPSAAPTPPPALFGSSPPAPTPTPLPSPQYLPAGPNNPAGVIWIDLAKSDSPDTPLPYGLNGTSIPDHLRLMDSIGGFRMANWNIARAVRLLPSGTPLTWKSAAPTPPPPPTAEPPAIKETPAAVPATPPPTVIEATPRMIPFTPAPVPAPPAASP